MEYRVWNGSIAAQHLIDEVEQLGHHAGVGVGAGFFGGHFDLLGAIWGGHLDIAYTGKLIMSRKKYQQGDKTFGARLRSYRLLKGLNSIELSAKIGVSQSSLSDYENNKSNPTQDTLARLKQNTDINIIWLLTGEGEPLTKSVESQKTAADDLRIKGLLAKARIVLASDTHYAGSLAANIESFHAGIETEGSLTKRVEILEKSMQRPVNEVRGDDPPEKKDELLKMRVK